MFFKDHMAAYLDKLGTVNIEERLDYWIFDKRVVGFKPTL